MVTVCNSPVHSWAGLQGFPHWSSHPDILDNDCWYAKASIFGMRYGDEIQDISRSGTNEKEANVSVEGNVAPDSDAGRIFSPWPKKSRGFPGAGNEQKVQWKQIGAISAAASLV